MPRSSTSRPSAVPLSSSSSSSIPLASRPRRVTRASSSAQSAISAASSASGSVSAAHAGPSASARRPSASSSSQAQARPRPAASKRPRTTHNFGEAVLEDPARSPSARPTLLNGENERQPRLRNRDGTSSGSASRAGSVAGSVSSGRGSLSIRGAAGRAARVRGGRVSNDPSGADSPFVSNGQSAEAAAPTEDMLLTRLSGARLPPPHLRFATRPVSTPNFLVPRSTLQDDADEYDEMDLDEEDYEEDRADGDFRPDELVGDDSSSDLSPAPSLSGFGSGEAVGARGRRRQQRVGKRTAKRNGGASADARPQASAAVLPGGSFLDYVDALQPRPSEAQTPIATSAAMPPSAANGTAHAPFPMSRLDSDDRVATGSSASASGSTSTALGAPPVGLAGTEGRARANSPISSSSTTAAKVKGERRFTAAEKGKSKAAPTRSTKALRPGSGGEEAIVVGGSSEEEDDGDEIEIVGTKRRAAVLDSDDDHDGEDEAGKVEGMKKEDDEVVLLNKEGAVNGAGEEWDEDSLLSAYNCPICFCQPERAVLTDCGHILCGKCLLDSLLAAIKRNPYSHPSGTQPSPRGGRRGGRGRGHGPGGAGAASTNSRGAGGRYAPPPGYSLIPLDASAPQPHFWPTQWTLPLLQEAYLALLEHEYAAAWAERGVPDDVLASIRKDDPGAPATADRVGEVGVKEVVKGLWELEAAKEGHLSANGPVRGARSGQGQGRGPGYVHGNGHGHGQRQDMSGKGRRWVVEGDCPVCRKPIPGGFGPEGLGGVKGLKVMLAGV